MVHRIGVVGIGVAVLALPFALLAQGEPCQDLQKAKQEIYGFRPSELAKEHRKAKSGELDAFWDVVKAKGPDGVGCLRQMILEEDDDAFFLFDAASLLYELDNSDASLPAVLHALTNTSLDEVDPGAYVRFSLLLSRRGVDIGRLAARYVNYPKVDIYLVTHGGLKLDRESGAIILYGSMDPALSDRYLAEILQAEEPHVRATAALLLALGMSDNGLKALRSLGEHGSFPKEINGEIELALTHSRVTPTKNPKFSREQIVDRLQRIIALSDEASERTFREAFDRLQRAMTSGDEATKAAAEREFNEMLGRHQETPTAADDDFEASAVATLSEQDVPVVREARRRSIRGVSDEVLYEYLALTRILRGVINRLDLYKDLRDH